jgi:cellulose synthase/poly-beta-1,6-N-acetylglucosamine synthase-like glycosyltransferase
VTAPDALLLAAFYALLLALAACGAQRWLMVALHARHRRERPRPAAPLPSDPAALPRALVQVPVFNEGAAALRALDAAARLDWPRDRLLVQVLDDSTDGTPPLLAARAEEWRARGVRVAHVRRGTREGLKAGALAHGLALSDAELVAVFDADFVPPENFLREAAPYFADPRVGLVQARWEPANRGASLTAALGAIGLDGHLAVEQPARHRSGRFFNFNGTAGVWRRRAIEESGGWERDTLVEDLDLSFRAQLRGWRFVYLDDLVVPCEAPADMNALRAQQRRWMRGGAQAARKLLLPVLRAPLAPHVKLEAALQLVMGAAYPAAVALALLLPLVLAVPFARARAAFALVDLPLLLAAAGAPFAFYAYAQRVVSPAAWGRRLALVPAVVALGVGLAPSNALGFLGGLLSGGAPGAWIPTPKGAGAAACSRSLALSRPPLEEALLAAWSAWTGWVALEAGRFGALPFLALATAGALFVAGRALLDARAARAEAAGGAASPERPEAAPEGGLEPAAAGAEAG